MKLQTKPRAYLIKCSDTGLLPVNYLVLMTGTNQDETNND